MDRDDLITEMALTWLQGGGDYLSYLTAHDEIADQIAQREEEMADERTRLDLERAAEMDHGDYLRKARLEEPDAYGLWDGRRNRVNLSDQYIHYFSALNSRLCYTISAVRSGWLPGKNRAA